MQTIHVTTRQTDLPIDSITPVQAYARLRDTYARSLLFECNTASNDEDRYSYICLDPLIELEADQLALYCVTASQKQRFPFSPNKDFSQTYDLVLQHLKTDGNSPAHNGLFGHTSFEAHQLKNTSKNKENGTSPILFNYALFRFVLVFDHSRHKLQLIENRFPEESSQKKRVLANLTHQAVLDFPFELISGPLPVEKEEAIAENISRAINHCKKGDTFQLVLSRGYTSQFQGDDFQVYRQLRALNPSPYLFYFDYGNYRLMGSSPELQISIDKQIARVKPIAGTYPRAKLSDNAKQVTEKLLTDPKENAEHVMLVDLARNDLGMDAKNIVVEAFKTIETYSHVHHMVSSVRGDLSESANPVSVFLNTFPAGTLTGAPKTKALELINKYEIAPRNWYGGAVGFFNLNGDVRQAIAIRSLFSQNNHLHYRAGAGIVAVSSVKKEMQEMNQKMRALFQATEQAANTSINIL